ncbi:plastocyanin/azurin family copper-binding protein [Pelagibius sp. Alg239-R121]|uniref:cupredoxin domain-containing protein n=1 Tax=Pelagibius sp. Alg239-R121 TaxID=2993448 RepID=UPI0024A64885|nr:plastocyanin/azurin family copper-binding protein [Pelagibius sp. Alg239-R121]
MKIFKNKVISAAALALLAAAFGAVTATASTNHTISQTGKKFSEKKMSIAAGDSITFVNDDKVKHNIVIKKMDVSTGIQQPGEKVDVAFDENGKFKVRCGIHPKMKITVVVN